MQNANTVRNIKTIIEEHVALLARYADLKKEQEKIDKCRIFEAHQIYDLIGPPPRPAEYRLKELQIALNEF